MNTIFIIIALLLLGGGVAIYKFKLSAKKPVAKKPAKKAKGNIVKKDDPFYEKNPDRDPLVKLAKDAEKKVKAKVEDVKEVIEDVKEVKKAVKAKRRSRRKPKANK